jgi:hypothetical protein
MSLHTPQPFATYVYEHEYARSGDARRFEFALSYLIEGTQQQVFLRWPWSYSETEQQLDAASGLDGCGARRARELTNFERYVESQLHKHHERLYAVEGQELLVRGRAEGATRTYGAPGSAPLQDRPDPAQPP